MQTVRRLYLYVMSGVTLAVLGVGLTFLLDALLRQLGLGQGSLIGGDPDAASRQVSLAVALIGVGLPVWLVHWWIIERGLRPTSGTREAERGSALRALYLALVLFATLVVFVNGASTLVRWVGHAAADVAPEFGFDDPSSALPPTIVGVLIWLYHVGIRRRDLFGGPLAGAAAWPPRLYLYGAAALGLSLMLEAVGTLAGVVAGVAADVVAPVGTVFGGESSRRIALVDTVASVLVWATVWLGHWWYLARVTRRDDWQGASERLSRVRLAYFVGVTALSAALVLIDLATAGRAILVALLGATEALGIEPGRDLFVGEVIVPLLGAIPWAWAGWIHLRWVRREAGTSEEPGRALQVERLGSHALALVGLAFGASGLAWLVGLLLDVVLGGQRIVAGGSFWRVELAQFVPLALLGSGLWLWNWRRIVARRVLDPVGEALSTVRRGALLLTLAGTILGALGSAAVVLYRLVAALLRVDVSGNAVSELSTPLGVLLVAAAVAVYHGLAVRQDLAVRAAGAEAAAGAEGTVEAPAGVPPAVTQAGAAAPAVSSPPTMVGADRAPAPGVHRALVLAGPPGADLDAALEALRLALPAEHTLEEKGAQSG